MKIVTALLALLLCPLAAHAADKTPSPIPKESRHYRNFQLASGYLLSTSLLNGIGSQEPRAYGSFLIILSPMMAGFASGAPGTTWRSAVVAGGATAGFGVYNRRMASRELSTSEVFERNMLVTSTPMVAAWLYNTLFEDTDMDGELTSHPVRLSFDGDATLLSYSTTW